jgi:hypothetical protein
VPVGVTGHRTQRPRGQVGPPGPHTAPSPTQLLTGPRGRTAANLLPPLASGPCDRTARSWSQAKQRSPPQTNKKSRGFFVIRI